ncbi:hypothetical protein [Streptomyces sp. bgisy060]|uniref:hypothetical protein n=1 Tax=Streptomyces sp. bgisy060 TaxID=3413775 RepID=UPI003EB69749
MAGAEAPATARTAVSACVPVPAHATANRGNDVPVDFVSSVDVRGTRHRTATAREAVVTPPAAPSPVNVVGRPRS